MSYIYSQALVEAYLPDNYSDTDASVQSNGNHTHKPFLWHDKTMEHSRLSRFGMTCKPLTESHGEELLMSFVAGFRVKTSVQPEKAQELKEKEAVCGSTWRGLLAKYDHNTSSWKTAQCSLLGDSEEFLETWPRWGTMQNGELYLRQIPALRICEKEYGLSQKWPTPRSCSAMASTITPESSWNEKRNPNLETIVGRRIYPTPTAHNAKETNAPSESMRNTPTLASVAGGRLNPNWVEWLMGWPIGHTDLKPLETVKYQEWQQQHSTS